MLLIDLIVISNNSTNSSSKNGTSISDIIYGYLYHSDYDCYCVLLAMKISL